MRPARLSALSLALLLVAVTASAGTLTLRATTGLANSDLGGWNKPLSDYSRVAAMNYDPLGPSLRSQVELSWRPVRAFSLGVTGSYQEVKSYEVYDTPGFTRFEDHVSIALQRVTGRLAWWPARLPGVYVGGEAGSATAKAKDAIRIVPISAPSEEYKGDWTGSSPVYALFVGAERRLGRHGLLGHVEVGYDFQSMGQLGDSRYDPALVEPVAVARPDAPALKTDFSGVHVLFGLGWALGRHD